MGVGDELMAAGEAGHIRHKITDRKGKPRWHPVWEFCPSVVRPSVPGQFPTLRNAGHCRPYIDYSRSTNERWAWKKYRPRPAVVNVEPDLRFDGMVLIEPNLKSGAPLNKLWPHWATLARQDVPWVQIGPPGTTPLPDVRFIATPTLRDMLAAVAGCSYAVLPEGGLHHACAAVGTLATVIYGAFITPDQTGYNLHRNLFIDDPEAQGWRIPNKQCVRHMASITVDQVIATLP